MLIHKKKKKNMYRSNSKKSKDLFPLKIDQLLLQSTLVVGSNKCPALYFWKKPEH